MDNLLQIPKELNGNWENLLILTYGADIPFWENSLWRELNGSCRNIIILADGNQYLKEMSQCADSGLAHYLNKKYIFDGIFVPHAAHGKFILLTNPDSGKLLVGSGNLGIQGYASGGELFTKYEYDPDKLDKLSAFIGIKNYLDFLIEEKLISDISSQHIQKMYTDSPWFYSKPRGSTRPVMSNLEKSFLSQLDELIDEPLLKLWTFAPFYDKECKALSEIIKTLKPKNLILLLQPKYTSVDPGTLERVLSENSEKYSIRSVHPKNIKQNIFLHAKLIIAETPTKEICLQGSPNLSYVAMINSGSHANHEIANLLSGAIGEFSSLLDNLEISPDNVDPKRLEIGYRETDPDYEIDDQPFYITRGEINRKKLIIFYRGELPDSKRVTVKVGDLLSPIDIEKVGTNFFTSTITEAIQEKLSEPLPLCIFIDDENLETFSNSIFLFNIFELEKMLDEKPSGSSEQGLKSLDFNDEELEELLNELEGSMLVDRRSVWQLAGKDIPKGGDEDDEVLHLEYADIDFDMLKSHPKILQYSMPPSKRNENIYNLPLPRVMASILDAFKAIKGKTINQNPDSARALSTQEGIIDVIISPGDLGEAPDHPKQSRGGRIRRILKRFIKRFIHGLSSKDYLEFAGPKIITRNYIIFLRLLWLLFSREYLENEFLIEKLIKIWTLYFGTKSQEGVFNLLDSKEKDQAAELIMEYHADSLMISSLYYCALQTRIRSWNEIRISLRDFWNEYVVGPLIAIDKEVIEYSWRYLSELEPQNLVNPSQIVQELFWLSQFGTNKELLSEIEEKYNLPKNCCSFRRERVNRPSINQMINCNSLIIDCDQALESVDKGVSILQTWRGLENQEYFRVTTEDKARLLWYDTQSKRGLFYIKETREIIDFENLPSPKPPKWLSQMKKLEEIASRIERETA